MKIYFKIIFFIFAFFILTTTLIISDGLTDNANTSDLIVILGNKVEPGGLPSPRLRSRLDKGYDLYQKKFAPLILVSGGLGKEGYDEGGVMKNYLLERGVPEEAIITDNKGTNTLNTAKNTKKIMTEKNLSSALIVSNYYHISRTKLAFKKSGIPKISGAHANYFEIRDLYSIPRETIGYYYYLIK